MKLTWIYGVILGKENPVHGRLAILHTFQQYFSQIGKMVDDNERLCAMEPCLRLRRFASSRA